MEVIGKKIKKLRIRDIKFECVNIAERHRMLCKALSTMDVLGASAKGEHVSTGLSEALRTMYSRKSIPELYNILELRGKQ